MKRLVIAITVLLALTSMSFAYKIIIVAADDDEAGTQLISQLKSQPNMNTVDWWNTNTKGLPSLAQIQAYDGVMTFSDYDYPDATAWGNRLADYVDSGSKRCVVTAAFCYMGGYELDLKGKFADTPYNPFKAVNDAFGGDGYTLNVAAPDIPGHAILDQVSSLWCYLINADIPLTSCGVSVCKWTNKMNAIAYSKQKRVVGFTGFVGYGEYGYYTGDAARMIRNAFVWMIEKWYGTSVETTSIGNIKALYK